MPIFKVCRVKPLTLHVEGERELAETGRPAVDITESSVGSILKVKFFGIEIAIVWETLIGFH